MISRKTKIFCFAGIVILLAATLPAAYWFFPAVYATLRCLFFPEQVYWINVTCGGKEYRLPLYYKHKGHETFESRKKFPVLVLCNLPLPPENYRHLKIFPNGIGVFQTPSEWFVVTPNYLHLKSGACLTMPIEEDMKGWEANYNITRQNGRYIYNIAPSGEKRRNRPRIEFTIPEFLLKNIPELTTHYRIEKRINNKLCIFPHTEKGTSSQK